MPTQPWYRNGLNFQCTGCGDCCTGEPGYVWVNKTEIETMAAHLKMDVAKFEKKHVRLVGIRRSLIEFANGDCVFFDNCSRGCKIYAARPLQCRTWPFWDGNLASIRNWKIAGERCPGIGRGGKVPLERIVELRDATEWPRNT